MAVLLLLWVLLKVGPLEIGYFETKDFFLIILCWLNLGIARISDPFYK